MLAFEWIRLGDGSCCGCSLLRVWDRDGFRGLRTLNFELEVGGAEEVEIRIIIPIFDCTEKGRFLWILGYIKNCQ